jgi:sulfur-oxidizing protein SoxX
MVQEHHHRNVRLVAVLGLSLLSRVALAQADKPLTDMPGDAMRGKAVAVNSDLGNCSICHHIPVAEIPDGANGDIGPPLDGVGSRLTAAELRQRIVNPKLIDPDTLMPAYFSTEGLTRVQEKYAGKTILTAQQVEDLIAFLLTLKGD